MTSLDCFLKHVSTKSYQKYISQNVPGFKKSTVKTILFPEVKPKISKKPKELSLNASNLELLGQKQFSGESHQPVRKNLIVMKRKINREVKSWCLKEAKSANRESQIIDYHTFKYKTIN